jgi:peptide chain release factor 2
LGLPCASWKPNKSTASPTSSTIWRSAPPSCGGIFDYDQKRERLTLLNKEMEDPKIWDDAKKRPGTGPREKIAGKCRAGAGSQSRAASTTAANCSTMGKEEGDDDTLLSVEADVAELEKQVAALEFRRMFNNPMDPSPASWKSRPAPAVPKRRTGPRCCCACT